MLKWRYLIKRRGLVEDGLTAEIVTMKTAQQDYLKKKSWDEISMAQVSVGGPILSFFLS